MSKTSKDGQLIKWVDGMPVPVYREPIDRSAISDLGMAALSLPYAGEILQDPKTKELLTDIDTGDYLRAPIDKRFEGMTNAEVMMIRMAEAAARGDYDAFDKILDRSIGKPKQVNENLNVNATYEDYLMNLAKDVGDDPEIADAEFITEDGEDVAAEL